MVHEQKSPQTQARDVSFSVCLPGSPHPMCGAMVRNANDEET